MKRVTLGFTFAIAAALVAGVLSGCGERPVSTNGLSARSALQKPTPEESFELIVETFRRGVEDIPIGFVVQREGGHSMMSGRNAVSHELIRPAKEGDPYRGIITVDSEWKYSVQSTEEEEDDRKDASKNKASSALDDAGNASGVEILDSDLIGTTGSGGESRRPLPSAPVHRNADEKVRSYELRYENGRWSLLTELDPETEQAIMKAFDRALKTQI